MAMLLSTYWNGNELWGQGFCGNDGYYALPMQDDDFIDYMQEMLGNTNEAVQRMNGTGEIMVVNIPIIFHIVHKGTPVGVGDNILYQDVVDAYDRLNLAFDGSGISFCLAQRDDDGNQLIEPGVVRLNAASIPEYVNNGVSIGEEVEYEVKTLSPQGIAHTFDNYSYCKVWVVDNIVGNNIMGIIQGVGYFPGTSVDEIDGVLIRHSVFNDPLNKVLIHEVGHYLGLFHTFEGDDLNHDQIPETCPSATAMFPLSDNLSDTQPHQRSGSGTCPSGNNPCSNGDFLENISNNHMDYSEESCRLEFTSGQVLHMKGTIECHRNGLTHSLGCSIGCDPVFPIDFTYNPKHPLAADGNGNNGQPANFTASSNLTSYEWRVDGVLQSVTNVNLIHTFQIPGEHVVCLRSSQNGCELEVCKDVYVSSSKLCTDPISPACELLLNGDFQMTDLTENHHLQTASTYSRLCNWTKNGTPNVIFLNNQEIAVSMNKLYSANANNNDYYRSLPLYNLVLGNSYTISFDYQFAKRNNNSAYPTPKMFIGFEEEIKDFDNFCEISNITGPMNLLPNVTGYIYELEQSNFLPYEYEFIYECPNNRLTFAFDEEVGNYLFSIKNISIKECNICIPEPGISYTQVDQCTFDFVFDKGIDEGTMYWTIESGPSGTSETHTQSFILAGEYEVCLYAQCEGSNVSKCITVRSEGCEMIDCNGVFISSVGPQCPDNQTSTINFSLNIPTGYGPCGENLYITPQVNYSDYFFNAETGLLMVSANVDDPIQISTIVVCGPDGSQLCYTVGGISQGSNQCDECIDVTVPVIATCNDPIGSDLNFVYSGSFSITPPNGATLCGSSSTTGGYVQGNSSQNGDTFTFPFTINTNNPNPSQSEIVICFEANSIKSCYSIRIIVENPCVPTECIEIENQSTLRCDRVENGIAIFEDVGHVLFIQDIFRDGFVLCDGREVSLDNGTVTLEDHWTTTSQNGYVTITSLSIPCEEVSASGQTTMTFNFCNDQDEELCVDLTFNLECDGCPHNRLEGRSQKSNQQVDDIEIFPNPAKDYVTIRSSNDAPYQTFTLMDLTGKVLLSDKLIKGYNTISIQDYAGGIYYIQIEKDGNTDTHKILIVK